MSKAIHYVKRSSSGKFPTALCGWATTSSERTDRAERVSCADCMRHLDAQDHDPESSASGLLDFADHSDDYDDDDDYDTGEVEIEPAKEEEERPSPSGWWLSPTEDPLGTLAEELGLGGMAKMFLPQIRPELERFTSRAGTPMEAFQSLLAEDGIFARYLDPDDLDLLGMLPAVTPFVEDKADQAYIDLALSAIGRILLSFEVALQRAETAGIEQQELPAEVVSSEAPGEGGDV